MDMIRSAPAKDGAARPTRLNHQAIAPRDEALLTLGLELRRSGYRFTSVTPATHHRVIIRKPNLPLTCKDVFGWSRIFGIGDVSPHATFSC